MKVLAINGSPRKDKNTATMLKNALEGVASQGAEIELIHLYDLNFKGCTSCLACRQTDGKSFSKCAMRDELTPVLEKILDVDAILLGSPIYFTSMSAGMRGFYERAAYPYMPLGYGDSSRFPKKINIGLILTLGAEEKLIKEMGMDRHFELTEKMMGFIFGSAELLIAASANIYKDDTKNAAPNDEFDEFTKRSEEMFTNNCMKAFDMGVRLLENKNQDFSDFIRKM
ncbi:flavodoxin family protein [Lacrimispora sp.]|uniref:flavodoxin family protein n=1 Tax=Lacrimispora sp. TaxID=2719234 RepID=UPI0032E36E1F